jgi:drug/metabolite transporter, DME family
MPENRRVTSGALLCLAAALAYTTANVCMRRLVNLRCDPFWVIFGRELVATAAIVPWVAYRAMRGLPTLPHGRTLWNILLVGVLIQVAGNVSFQWALGVVGLAVTVPVVFAVSITGGAALGRAVLGEEVSVRSAAAMGLLLASLGLLAMGAASMGNSTPGGDAIGPAAVVLGVAAAALAGGVYALLNITIRHSVTGTTLPCAVGLLIPLMGAVSLGPIALARSGVPAWSSTSGEVLLLIVAAGFLNIIGFLAFIYGLQRTTVVYANAVNASQVAMAAVAGMAIFAEPPNPWIVGGVALTVVGIVWIDRPVEAYEDIPPP